MQKQTFSLKVEKELNATPEMAFDAWLDQNNIAKWLMPVEGGKTNLTLTHELLPTEEQRNNHEGGWNRILNCLDSFANQ